MMGTLGVYTLGVTVRKPGCTDSGFRRALPERPISANSLLEMLAWFDPPSSVAAGDVRGPSPVLYRVWVYGVSRTARSSHSVSNRSGTGFGGISDQRCWLDAGRGSRLRTRRVGRGVENGVSGQRGAVAAVTVDRRTAPSRTPDTLAGARQHLRFYDATDRSASRGGYSTNVANSRSIRKVAPVRGVASRRAFSPHGRAHVAERTR